MRSRNKQTGRKLWSSPFAHHLFVAFTLTSIVFLATHVGTTKFLDGLAISSSQWLLTHQTDSVENEGENDPVLISISPEDYREFFDTISPLKRNVLATGLTRLFDSKPKAVLIDLDLSPSTSEYKEGDHLDRVLDGAVEQQDKIQLVLITPIRSEISSAAERWLRQRCQKGVKFAFSSVESEFGVVLRYREQYPSLGVVARTFVPEPKQDAESTICTYLDDVPLAESQLEHTSQPQDQKWSINDLDEMVWRRASHKDVKYIQWKRLQHVKPISWKRLVTEENLNESFSNRLVFVGSHYDQHDRFQSPLGPKPGVHVHMAVAYSNVSETHIVPYYLEVFVGTFLGIFGAWCWKIHHKSRKRHVERAANNQLTVWGHARRFATRGLLFLTPTLTGTIVFLLIMYLSVDWLVSGIWINPAPLALGIVFDILMLGDETSDEFEHPGHRSGKRASSFVLHPSRWFFQVPLIVCAHWFLIDELIH